MDGTIAFSFFISLAMAAMLALALGLRLYRVYVVRHRPIPGRVMVVDLVGWLAMAVALMVTSSIGVFPDIDRPTIAWVAMMLRGVGLAFAAWLLAHEWFLLREVRA